MARYLLRYLTNNVMLAPGDFTLGRSPDCGLPLDDEKVSRRHAVLHVGPDSLAVEDLESRNGVFVNGARVEGTSTLSHGDVMTIGRQTLYIIEEEERMRRAVAATVGSAEESEDLRRQLGMDAPPPAEVEPTRPEPDGKLEKLSPREREVLRLLALGHTNKEVANQLDVSVKTVETYRTRLGEKLEMRSRADLVRYALSSGLLDDEREG